MATQALAKAPVHLWIVGVVSLLWNAFGGYDYVMTQTDNEQYLSGMMGLSEADRAYFVSFPAWADAAWALGVWGAVLGSLLLLIRSRYAVWAFGVSLAGTVVSVLYQFALSPMPEDLRGTWPLIVGVLIVAIALFVYAQRMQAKGVLR